MTSVCEPGGRSQRTNSFEADIEDKKIRCDRQKVCYAKVMVHQTMFSRFSNRGHLDALIGCKCFLCPPGKFQLLRVDISNLWLVAVIYGYECVGFSYSS